MSSVVAVAHLVRLLKQRHQCVATPAELREQLELLAAEAPTWYAHEDTPLRGKVAKMKTANPNPNPDPDPNPNPHPNPHPHPHPNPHPHPHPHPHCLTLTLTKVAKMKTDPAIFTLVLKALKGSVQTAAR